MDSARATSQLADERRETMVFGDGKSRAVGAQPGFLGFFGIRPLAKTLVVGHFATRFE